VKRCEVKHPKLGKLVLQGVYANSGFETDNSKFTLSAPQEIMHQQILPKNQVNNVTFFVDRPSELDDSEKGIVISTYPDGSLASATLKDPTTLYTNDGLEKKFLGDTTVYFDKNGLVENWDQHSLN
jgi:hypothetical protein